MSICPFAISIPGPDWKRGYSGQNITHTKTGIVIHSAEYESEWDEKVLHNALHSGRIASWHYTVTQPPFMFVFEHYPPETTCWHAGYPANLWTVGIECEGIAPDKIDGQQYELVVKLIRWLQGHRGWSWPWGIGRAADRNLWLASGPTLWEHNEAQEAYTDCQVFSRHMIDPLKLIQDLKEEPVAFTEEQRQEINKIAQFNRLELDARMAVEAEILRAVAAVKEGDWRTLPAHLALIEGKAKTWHRWPG